LSDRTGTLDGTAWSVKAPSRRSRLVEVAVALSAECSCASSVVGVLRGFGTSGRVEAATLRRRVGRHGVRVQDMPVAITATTLAAATARGESDKHHVCVFVDATGGEDLVAERVAALSGVPLVTARRPRQGDPGEPRSERLAVLRTFSDHGDHPLMFPSVSGQTPDVAFEEVRVTPNQPETGELRLVVGAEMPQTLPIGTEVVVVPLSGMARVEAKSGRGEENRTWIAPSVEIEQVSGIHTVHRDGLCVADLNASLSVAAQRAGLRRCLV
jgi:hypothetical protein